MKKIPRLLTAVVAVGFAVGLGGAPATAATTAPQPSVQLTSTSTSTVKKAPERWVVPAPGATVNKLADTGWG